MGEDTDSVVFVHNFSTEAAVVTVSGTPIDGSDGLSTEVELPAGESVAVTAGQLVEGEVSFTADVNSDQPVVVERLQVWKNPADLSIQAAIPVLETIDELFDLAG